jgi:hypothetical protein
VQRVSVEKPPSLLVDADEYELILVGIDRLDDALRRLKRYLVLGRATAEHNAYTNPFVH